jgi:hypothetical protein
VSCSLFPRSTCPYLVLSLCYHLCRLIGWSSGSALCRVIGGIDFSV